MDQLLQRARAFRAWFLALEPARRLWLLAIGGLGLAGLVIAWQVATYERLVPVVDTPMDTTTTHAIVEHLKSIDEVYDVEEGTGRVLVRDHRVADLRVSLGGQGLVSDKTVGLELFEESRFGSTRFVEHIRYVRGLQGEVERALNSFDSVRSSKVLLSLPEDALFEEDQEPPSASVYVDLVAGRTLSKHEGAELAEIVANAVPRLDVSAVQIMDSEMRVLHASEESEGEAGAASSLASLQREHERNYKREVERILERVLGPGRVVARVNVVLDNAERTVAQRKLHAEQAVAVQSNTKEKTERGGGVSGIPGTGTNVKGAQVQQGVTGPSKESSESTENAAYDVPHTTTTEATLPGGIKSITAAVLVDGAWKKPEGAEDGAEPEYVARTEQELASYKSLVAGALGIKPDAVTVVNQPFAKVEVPAAPKTTGFVLGPQTRSLMRYGFALLALLLTFGFIVRPVMRQVIVPTDPEVPGELEDGVAGALAAPAEQEDLADLLGRISSGNDHITRDEVSRLVSSDLTHSLVTLQSWLSDEEG